MDVGLSPGQLALRDSVRDVLRTECPPWITRQGMPDPERLAHKLEDHRRPGRLGHRRDRRADALRYLQHRWQGAAALGDSRAVYHDVGSRFGGGAA